MTTTPAEPTTLPTTAKAAAKTAYHVLQEIEWEQPDGSAKGKAFLLVATDVTASSAEHAIRIYGEKATETVTLIAVPSRSWKAVKLTVETRKIVTLEAT